MDNIFFSNTLNYSRFNKSKSKLNVSNLQAGGWGITLDN